MTCQIILRISASENPKQRTLKTKNSTAMTNYGEDFRGPYLDILHRQSPVIYTATAFQNNSYTQRNIFEILLSLKGIRLYLPFSD